MSKEPKETGKELPTEPGESSKNSVFGEVAARKVIAELPILPIRDTKAAKTEPTFDIVDEALYHMRTNIFMKDFPLKSGADRLLIYLTFYGAKCLKIFGKYKDDKAKCLQEIQASDLKGYPLPGDESFILKTVVGVPKDAGEKADLKKYFDLLRREMAARLVEKVFPAGATSADKWWICFSGKKFMDKELEN